jgi:hypothetical protein
LVILETEREGSALKFIQRVYESYLRITGDFSDFLAQNPSLHDEWLRLGYKLVEVKGRIRNSHAMRHDPIEVIIEEVSTRSGPSEATEDPIVEDSNRDPPEGERIISLAGVEVVPPAPIMDEGENKVESTFQGNSPGDVEARPEIRPLIDVETSESCGYCPIFRDIGTMVCPNCGRPLNLKIVQ